MEVFYTIFFKNGLLDLGPHDIRSSLLATLTIDQSMSADNHSSTEALTSLFGLNFRGYARNREWSVAAIATLVMDIAD